MSVDETKPDSTPETTTSTPNKLFWPYAVVCLLLGVSLAFNIVQFNKSEQLKMEFDISWRMINRLITTLTLTNMQADQSDGKRILAECHRGDTSEALNLSNIAERLVTLRLIQHNLSYSEVAKYSAREAYRRFRINPTPAAAKLVFEHLQRFGGDIGKINPNINLDKIRRLAAKAPKDDKAKRKQPDTQYRTPSLPKDNGIKSDYQST